MNGPYAEPPFHIFPNPSPPFLWTFFIDGSSYYNVVSAQVD